VCGVCIHGAIMRRFYLWSHRVLDTFTDAIRWIERRLNEGEWFRRGSGVAATILTWQVTLWAMRFAEVNASRPGLEIAAMIAAVSAVPGAVVTFAFNQYLSSKGK
jgi:hypothetical protein